jgi:hypothetical protein
MRKIATTLAFIATLIISVSAAENNPPLSLAKSSTSSSTSSGSGGVGVAKGLGGEGILSTILTKQAIEPVNNGILTASHLALNKTDFKDQCCDIGLIHGCKHDDHNTDCGCHEREWGCEAEENHLHSRKPSKAVSFGAE